MREVRHPAIQNPTVVVLSDRYDLVDQLFEQYQRCADSRTFDSFAPGSVGLCPTLRDVHLGRPLSSLGCSKDKRRKLVNGWYSRIFQ